MFDTTGGGLANLGVASVRACTFTDNHADIGGGIASFGSGNSPNSLTVTGCAFTKNSNSAIDSDTPNALVDDSTFTDNRSLQGLSLIGGGAIINRHSMTIDSCTFTGNQAQELGRTAGGAIISVGPLFVINSVFSANLAQAGSGADAQGGAINGGDLMIIGSRFSSNRALAGSASLDSANVGGSAEGGAIWSDGSTFLASDEFTSNQAIGGTGGAAAVGGDALGGALYMNAFNSGETLTGDNFSGNQAVGGSGGPGGNGGNGTDPKGSSGCSQYKTSFPSDARYCPTGNYDLGTGYVPGQFVSK